ncbi:MAG: NUDIX domain-containing protein [Devosia sp.]
MSEQRQMVCFDEGAARFQMRAAGIALRDGYLLVHRASVEDFWTLPGGRVERGESAGETLAREMVEELGQQVTVGPLVSIVENFFELSGRRYHELGLYHRMDVPDVFPFSVDGSICHRVRDGDSDLEFKWVRAERRELDDLRFKPSALIDHIAAGTGALLHVVEREVEPLPLLQVPA